MSAALLIFAIFVILMVSVVQEILSKLYKAIIELCQKPPAADETLPHIFKYLNKKDLLTCRLVCSEWQREAEKSIKVQNKITYTFVSLPDIKKFIKDTTKCPSSSSALHPFAVSSSVALLPSWDTPHFQFWTVAEELFYIFGREVEKLRIRILLADSPALSSIFYKVLKRAPNLQSLDVYAKLLSSTQEDSIDTNIPEQLDILNMVSETLIHFPIHQVPKELRVRLCRSSKQEYDYYTNNNNNNSDESEAIKGEMELDFDQQRSEFEMDWPLTFLKIRVGRSEWRDMSRLLNKFHVTLKKLVLTVYNDVKPKGAGLLRMELDQLKELDVTFRQYFITPELDFLRDLKSLEKLTMRSSRFGKIHMEKWMADKQFVQIWEYEDRMYESNIWRRLPKLQTVILETLGENGVIREYDRDTYNIYQSGLEVMFGPDDYVGCFPPV